MKKTLHVYVFGELQTVWRTVKFKIKIEVRDFSTLPPVRTKRQNFQTKNKHPT